MTPKQYLAGVRERRYKPPHIVVWRLLWFAPLIICAVVSTAIVFIGWGRHAGRDTWEHFLS